MLPVGQSCAAVSEATAAGMMAEVWWQGVMVVIANVVFPATTLGGSQMCAASGLLSTLTTYGGRTVGKLTFDLTRRVAFIFTETS